LASPRGWGLWAAVGAASVAAIAAIWFFVFGHKSSADIKTVGVILSEASGAEESALASSLSDTLLSALAVQGSSAFVLNARDDARRRGLRFILRGGVERQTLAISIHARLDDVVSGTTLWSQIISGSADETTSIRAEAAVKAADAVMLAQICSDG